MSKPLSDLIQPCFQNELTRRVFFDRVLRTGITAAVATLVPGAVVAEALAAPPPNQNEWRHCRRCRTLFYNGYRDKGICPARGRHDSDRVSNYKLTYNSPGPGQAEWRYCNKCKALFWNGYPNKGICPGGGGHFAQGYNFTLRFDDRAAGQRNWRFCNKCEVLFYNLEGLAGVCAAGGGHVAAGYKFVLDNLVRID